MEFYNLVENELNLLNQKISESNLSSGTSSVFGSGVTSTSSEFSKDSYATGDARKPHSLYGGIMTRSGMKKKSKKSNTKTKRK